jgi:oligopeptide transport system permease protein
MKRQLRRALGIPLILWVICSLTFVLLRSLPGSPFDRERAPASPEIEAAIRAEYHLDESLGSQYRHYLAGLLRGDLGPSLKYRNRSVAEILWQALPVSMSLGSLAFLAAMAMGIPAGIGAALARSVWGTLADRFLLVCGLCLPSFVFGPLLILVFGLWLPWFPVALWDSGRHAVLPMLALGIYFAARVSRLVREGLHEALRSPYILAARAKGLGTVAITLRHAIPVALIPVVSYAGPMMADLLTGSFVIESVFQIPGVGGFFVNSLFNRDYTLMLGLTLVYSSLVVTLNWAAECLVAWLDPRIRQS